jgi:chromosome segregation ATPase
LRDFGFTSIGVDFYLRGAQALADLLGEGKDAEKLDHPCRETCSGWRQGYERGSEARAAKDAAERETFLAEHDENVRLHTELEAARAEIAKLQAEARLHGTIVEQLQRAQKAILEQAEARYISVVNGRREFRASFKAARSRIASLEAALRTLRVAVNDKQPDPGAVAFIDKALEEKP